MATRRTFTVRVLAAVIALFVPAAVVAFTPLAPLTELAFVGLIPTLLALLHGRRFAIGTALATAALVALVELANPSPAAAVVLMVAVGLGVGASALRGWQTVATVVCTWPAVLLVGAPPDFSGADAHPSAAVVILLAGAVTLAGGLWTVLVGRVLLPDLPVSAPEPLRPIVAVIYGGALAVLLGIATLGTVTWGHGSMAGWVLLTILVVARPGYSETWHRIVARSLGTIAGGLAAAILSLVVPVEPVLTGVGIIALAAAIILQLKKANYAIYSVALTAAIVLLNATGTDVFGVDIERVLFTVLGALLTAAAVFVLQLALSRFARNETPDARLAPGSRAHDDQAA